jgi:hypothetical protein
MANNLDAFNPIFYAQEGLIAVMKALGLAGRVTRSYDDTRTAREKGDTINVRVPSAFVARDAPSTPQDIDTTHIDIKLDQHKEVKIRLTDKELAYTNQQIIAEHIMPAGYALADQIDQDLASLVDDVPWYSDWTSTATVADVTAFRAAMFKRKVPFGNPEAVHCMLDGAVSGELLALNAFATSQGAGDQGVATQLSGFLGRRYNINFFENQNAPVRTSATVADVAGAINNAAGYAAASTSIAVNGLSANAALKKGDIVVVTGHTQQYVLTADVTADGSGAATLAIFGSPFVAKGGLEAFTANSTVVTIVLAGGSGATKINSLAFHQGAFALGFARLPDFYNGQGVQVFSVLDPVTRLSLRARTFVDGNNSAYYVVLDTLYGKKTLDGNKAQRIRD